MKKFMGLLLVMTLVVCMASVALATENCPPLDCNGECSGRLPVTFEVREICCICVGDAVLPVVDACCNNDVTDPFCWGYAVTGCHEYELRGKLVELAYDEGTVLCGDWMAQLQFSLNMGSGWVYMPYNVCTYLRDLNVGCFEAQRGAVKLHVTPSACGGSGHATFLLTIFDTGCPDQIG